MKPSTIALTLTTFFVICACQSLFSQTMIRGTVHPSGGQQDQLIHQLSFQVVPGQESAYIRANAVDRKHAAAGTDFAWRTYVYSDHTIGFSVPIPGPADTERLRGGGGPGTMAGVAADHFSPPAREAKDPMLLARRERILRCHAELSYHPAAVGLAETLATPPAYYEIVRFRAKPGQLDKLLEHHRQLPALMRAVGSPLAFLCYSYDRGGEPNGIEIAYPADSADDLAERRAVHAALETEAIKEWRKVLGVLADEVRTITGRYFAEIAVPASLRNGK